MAPAKCPSIDRVTQKSDSRFADLRAAEDELDVGSH